MALSWRGAPALALPSAPAGGRAGPVGRLAFSDSLAILRLMPAVRETRYLMIAPAQPWHVPVRLEDVPETGLHFDLVADDHVRAGLAALAGVPDMPRLEAAIDVARYGNGLRAT